MKPRTALLILTVALTCAVLLPGCSKPEPAAAESAAAEVQEAAEPEPFDAEQGPDLVATLRFTDDEKTLIGCIQAPRGEALRAYQLLAFDVTAPGTPPRQIGESVGSFVSFDASRGAVVYVKADGGSARVTLCDPPAASFSNRHRSKPPRTSPPSRRRFRTMRRARWWLCSTPRPTGHNSSSGGLTPTRRAPSASLQTSPRTRRCHPTLPPAWWRLCRMIVLPLQQ